MVMYRESCRL